MQPYIIENYNLTIYIINQPNKSHVWDIIKISKNDPTTTFGQRQNQSFDNTWLIISYTVQKWQYYFLSMHIVFWTTLVHYNGHMSRHPSEPTAAVEWTHLFREVPTAKKNFTIHLPYTLTAYSLQFHTDYAFKATSVKHEPKLSYREFVCGTTGYYTTEFNVNFKVWH